MKTKIFKATTLGILGVFGVACLMNVNNSQKADAYGYEEGFKYVAGLDFTSDSQITHERDEEKSVEEGKLHYWSYAGDLLSIVDESDAASGKACLVATATDYPRTKFTGFQRGYLYKVSYTTKLADPTQWVAGEGNAFGISPYINFVATDGVNTEDESGHDFHRNYADVRYSPEDSVKVTTFFFDVNVVGTKNGARLKARLYDTFANAKAQNAADYYTFKKDGMLELDSFQMAFYQQGLLKTLSYEIYDFSISCYGANDGKPVTSSAWALDMNDPIVTDGGSAQDNPGKLAVNGKDDFLSVESNSVHAKDSTDYPRLRLNDSIIKSEGTYFFTYTLKMGDESKFNSSWIMSPYIEFTAYNGTDWNNPGGIDFHCGYKDVQYAYTTNPIVVSFYFVNRVVDNALVIDLYGTETEFTSGIPTQTINFPATYTQFAAFDLAMYKQGGTTQMDYYISDVKLDTFGPAAYEPAMPFASSKFGKPAQVLDFSDPEVVITDGEGKSAADKPGTICVNNKNGYLSVVEDAKDKVSGYAVQVKDSNDYPRIRFNNFTNLTPYKISYDLAMTDETKFNASWIMSPYINIIVHVPGGVNEWVDLGGVDFNCGYKDVKYSFSNKYSTVEFYVMAGQALGGSYMVALFSDVTALTAGVPTLYWECPEGTTEIGALDLAMYKQGGSNDMPYKIANCGMWTTCTSDEDHIDSDENGVCDYCGEPYVVEPVVTLDSITVSGAKNEFNAKDSFSSEGLVVTAHYSDGSTSDVTKDATVDASGVDMASAGTYTVKVKYLDKEASYNITVKAAVEPEPEPKKGGCGSSIIAASAIVSIIAIGGIALVLNKKKED